MEPFQRSNFKVPEGFPDLLKTWTREVLHYKPVDIIDFSVQYFRAMESGTVQEFLNTLPENGLIVNPNLKNPYYPEEVNYLVGGQEVASSPYARIQQQQGDMKDDVVCNPGDVVMYTTGDDVRQLGCCVSPEEKTVVFFEDPNEQVFEVYEMRPIGEEEALSIADILDVKRTKISAAFDQSTDIVAGLFARGITAVDVNTACEALIETCEWVEVSTMDQLIMTTVWGEECAAAGVENPEISQPEANTVWSKVLERIGSFLEVQVAERLRGQ